MSTRSAPGGAGTTHHHVTLALLAGAFLLTLEQDWGGKRPGVTRPQVTRVLRAVLPRRRWTHRDLRRWLDDTCCRNARAKAAHARRRLSILSKPSL
ncbi:MAG: hypothetical protein ACRDI2_01855 [Chloroflexota bacterium]